MKVIVLGAGLVGHPMAIDLKNSGFDVTVADVKNENLDKFEGTGLNTVLENLSEPENIKALIEDYDLVLNALPGFLGYTTLETVIKAGKDIVDISFFAKDPHKLDPIARENNVTAVYDCGVAPGMSNLLSGYAHSKLDRTDSIEIYVGGLPIVRDWPYEYKAVFSPVDVIEEYIRPARFVVDGKLVVKPALTDPELLNFKDVGTLEAFNTDGLRSIIKNIDCPNMIEKTMRYPGHIDLMKVLKHSGFFSESIISYANSEIRPIDFTSKILFDKWKLNPGDEDLTVMKIIVKGLLKEKKTTLTYELFDKYDKESEVHSMARTTGYTATAFIRMIREKLFTEKGLFPLELVGKNHKCVDFLLKDLKSRQVCYNETIED